MARMLTQVPLPLLPRDAAEIAPGVGVVTGPDGSGVVWVHGLATFAWDAGDEAARRLAAVQLVQLKAATQVQVARAFGVIPVSVWRWARALAGGGVAGLVPAIKGPQRASKLTPQVIGRIRDHPERPRHLHLGRGLQLHQLDRRQPPRCLIFRVPRERGQPVHPHHPAAVRAGGHAHPRRDLRRVPREQRQRHLGQHPGHHPASLSDSKPFIYYCGKEAREQAPAHRKRDKRPDQQPRDTP